MADLLSNALRGRPAVGYQPGTPLPQQNLQYLPSIRAASFRADPANIARYRQPAFNAAARYGVPANVLFAQIGQESKWDPNATAPDGGMGIAQFMPATARQYGLTNPYDPIAALNAAAHYDSDLIRQYGTVPRALQAYNSGSPTGSPSYAAQILAAAQRQNVPYVTMQQALGRT